MSTIEVVDVVVEPRAVDVNVLDEPHIEVVEVGVFLNQGPPGPPGTPGADSTVPGPQGETGSSSTLFQYKYNTGSSPPPATSAFRSDGNTAANSTVLWVHRQDAGNIDRKPLLMIAKAGSELYIQDTSDSTAFAAYHLTADPIDNGEYITFNVALDRNGGTPLAGGNNKPCLLGVIVPGPVGPPGPQGPPGPEGVWVQMTRAAYTALPVKDPNILYVIVG